MGNQGNYSLELAFVNSYNLEKMHDLPKIVM